MFRPHHARVVDGDIHINLVEIHILLRVGIDQIVKMMTRDGKHRHSVEFGVVKAVEQMNASGAGSREAHAEFAGVFGVAASHERGGLLVAHLDEADFLLLLAQRLHDSVDAVTGQPEDHFDTPFHEHFHQNVRCSFSHNIKMLLNRLNPPKSLNDVAINGSDVFANDSIGDFAPCLQSAMENEG